MNAEQVANEIGTIIRSNFLENPTLTLSYSTAVWLSLLLAVLISGATHEKLSNGTLNYRFFELTYRLGVLVGIFLLILGVSSIGYYTARFEVGTILIDNLVNLPREEVSKFFGLVIGLVYIIVYAGPLLPFFLGARLLFLSFRGLKIIKYISLEASSERIEEMKLLDTKIASSHQRLIGTRAFFLIITSLIYFSILGLLLR